MFRVSQLSYLQFGPVSFAVNPTEILMISGRSGCGKSTLFRAIADLDDFHHSAEVSLNGVRCSHIPPNKWRHRVGFLPAVSYWWQPRVGDHLKPCLDLLNQLLLPNDILNWEVSRLSSGEKQRLALIRLFQNEPQLLLLDEPTANLDGASMLATERVIQNYICQKNIPCVWISHSDEQIQRVGTYELRLPEGTLYPVVKET